MKVQCPRCLGSGEDIFIAEWWEVVVACYVCEGSGNVNKEVAEEYETR